MLAHIGLDVCSIEESNNFYEPLLAVINYEVIIKNNDCVAYGRDGRPILEIYRAVTPTSKLHLAFYVDNKEQVLEFYEKALSLGAKDNGAPGFRDYFPGYYAAFVIDPNGHNLEALFWEEKICI